MKDENEIELDFRAGVWSHPELVPSRPLTLGEKVEQIVSDQHSFRKSDQLALNSQKGYETYHRISWCPKQRELLTGAYKEGTSIIDLATAFSRTENAIRMQLENLGFIVDDSGKCPPWQRASSKPAMTYNPSTAVTYPAASKSFGDQIQELYG